MPDHTPPPSGPDADSGLAALAARWAERMMPKAAVTLSRAGGRRLLSEILGELAAAVTAEPFSADPARDGAERLARHRFVNPEVAGQAVAVLTGELLPAAGIAETERYRQRVLDLAAAFAEGFTAGVKETLLTDQEDMKISTVDAYLRADRKVTELSARMNAIFSTKAVGIGIGNLDGSVDMVNPRLAEMLGYRPDELRGRAIYELISEAAQQRIWRKYRKLCAGEFDRFVDEGQWTASDGEPIWIRATVSLVRNPDNSPAYPVAILDNTSDAHLLRDRLNDQSVYDELTRLSRFPAFRRRVRDALATAEPSDRLALCFFDLDGFKVINDGAGREAGDRVLRKVGNILSATFEPLNATVARVTGDGFAVLVADPPAEHVLGSLVDDALEQFREAYWQPDEGPGIACSASVGLVPAVASDMTADELITAAEITTHRAKLGGKTQWLGYDVAGNHELQERFRLGAEIAGALENGDFVTRFQPIVDLGDGTVTGVRSFARWDHATRGQLAPPAFLALAEDIGMAPDLAEWALKDVCKQAARWRTTLGSAAPVIELEFSVRTANQPTLVNRVLRTLEEHGIPGEALRLVFPLDSVADPKSLAVDSMWGLYDNGIGIAVSEVGSGALDLVGLGELPLEGIALSTRVPALLAGDEDSASLAERGLAEMVALCHDRSRTVTACDVDVTHVRTRLAAMGVDLAYGPAVAHAGTGAGVEHHFATATPGMNRVPEGEPR